MSAHEDGDAVALRADEIKRLRETVDILTARHEAGLEDRDRLRNERDEARAEVERAEPRRQRDERDLADAFAERDRLRAELDELHTLVAAQAAILTGVANALRGLDLRAAKVKHSPGDAGGFGPRPLPLSATKGERRRCSPC